MRTALLSLLILIGFLPVSPASAAADERLPSPTESVHLTLPDAISRGLAASHRLGEARARRDQSRARVDVNRTADLPEVSFLAGYQRTNHVEEFAIIRPFGLSQVIYPDVPDNYRTRLDFAWPIYTGGRTNALTRAAEAEADASESDLLAAQADLRLEITRAFWAYLTASESVRVVDEAVKREAAHLADVRNLLAVGLISPADVLSTEAQLSREQGLLIEARNTFENAATDLRRLVDLPPDSDIVLDASIDAPSPPLADLDALIDEARKARPERQADERRLAAAGERTSAARAGKIPMLSVLAGYDYARPNPRIFPREATWQDSWDVGINLSWSLWDSGRVGAAVAEATATRSAAQERLLEFDSQLDADVRSRRRDLESAQASVKVANDSVRSAEEARRVQGERFGAGLATSSDVRDADVALLQAGLERTRALASVRLAEARLERTIGR
jgi:outer membrane protein TolC